MGTLLSQKSCVWGKVMKAGQILICFREAPYPTEQGCPVPRTGPTERQP